MGAVTCPVLSKITTDTGGDDGGGDGGCDDGCGIITTDTGPFWVRSTALV